MNLYIHDTELISYPGWIEAYQITRTTPKDFGAQKNLVVTSNWANIFKRSCHLHGCLPSDVFIGVRYLCAIF